MGARTLLSHSFRIAWKDLTELFRNRLGLVLLILMPLFMMVMVGFIYPSSSSAPTNLPVALVNEDIGYGNSIFLGKNFTMALQQINSGTSPRMIALSNASSVSDIKSMVQKGDIEGGIVIPSNFTESILNGEQGTLIIIIDQSNPQVSATIQAALTGVFDQMGTSIARNKVTGLNPAVVNDNNSLAYVQPY
ncbi:MAG: ABC transporter permease, partial [Candidatus Bathyarchaeia archaeon]